MFFDKILTVPHCLDERKNEDETGVDCGGSCKPCKGIYFDNAYHFDLFLVKICVKGIYCQVLNYVFPIVSVTIELEVIDNTNGISWSISNTDCKSSSDNLQVIQNKLTETNCILLGGVSYTLKCLNTGEGWKRNYLVIENTLYCEGTTNEQLINITLTGLF